MAQQLSIPFDKLDAAARALSQSLNPTAPAAEAESADPVNQEPAANIRQRGVVTGLAKQQQRYQAAVTQGFATASATADALAATARRYRDADVKAQELLARLADQGIA